MLKLASDGIISFSAKPLKIIGGIGIASLFISFLVLIYSLLSYMHGWNNLKLEWILIIVAISFFAGIQLLSIWLISEYIARIYEEVKGRPQYIIDRKINIK